MSKRLFAVLTLVVILAPFCAEASTLGGTIYYSTTPMSDIVVDLCLGETGCGRHNVIASTVSDGSGHYEFLDVAPGTYCLAYPFNMHFIGISVTASDKVQDLHLTKEMWINGIQTTNSDLVFIHEQYPEFCWTHFPEATRFTFKVVSMPDMLTIEYAASSTDPCYQVQSILPPDTLSYLGIVNSFDYLNNWVGWGMIWFRLDTVPPNIEATPSSHDFGRIPARQCSALPREFILSNTGNGNLNVSAISLSNPKNFTLLLDGGANPCNVSNPTISPGGSCTVAVTFCPSSKGNKFADLTVTSNDPDTATLTVALSGTTLDSGWGWVVTIDGMSPWSSAFSWPNPTEYLSDAITDDEPHHWRSKIIQNVGPILPFIWTRNTGDTETTVQQLYEHIKFLNSTNRPVVILSHSWGTVLAYITLHEHDDIYVNKLITLGSPLDSLSPPVLAETAYWLARFGIFSVDKPENLGIWHNYWTLCDPITAPISALSGKDNFVNKKRYYLVRPAINLLDCHRCYFEDPSKWNKILKDVIKK